ncbi:MAG: YggS family pyridoxal phosphate-dependent enzyme [Pseudomonadota bacterium]
MQTLEQRWHSLWQRIYNAALSAYPMASPPTLLAVSKTIPPTVIEAAYVLGQRHFAENYLQEAIEKQSFLTARHPDIVWHFIGAIQSRKCAVIAQHFDWVHSLDRAKIALLLNDARTNHLPALNVCIQINISSENSKSGLQNLEDAKLLLDTINTLPNLHARGLMGIAAPHLSLTKQHEQFAYLRHIFEELKPYASPHWNVLSMGMSDDLEAAISEGATHLRIGSALFGSRQTLLK